MILKIKKLPKIDIKSIKTYLIGHKKSAVPVLVGFFLFTITSTIVVANYAKVNKEYSNLEIKTDTESTLTDTGDILEDIEEPEEVIDSNEEHSYKVDLKKNRILTEWTKEDGVYVRHEGKIYRYKIGNEELVGADFDTFLSSETGYGKDNNSVYYYSTKLEGADAKTFQVALNDHLAEIFAYDKNHVYIRGMKVEGADPGSFTMLNEGNYYKDNNNVYREGIHGGVTLVENADPYSFEIFGGVGWSMYTKDKSNIFCDGVKLEGVDHQTFDIKDSGYHLSADKNKVFYACKEVEGANPDTFEWVDESYARDNDQVFVVTNCPHCDGYCDLLSIDLDPNNFEIIGNSIAKDANKVFYAHMEFPNADSSSFISNKEEHFATDNNHIYYFSGYYQKPKIIEGISPEGFSIFNHRIFENKDGVYAVNYDYETDTIKLTNMEFDEFGEPFSSPIQN